MTAVHRFIYLQSEFQFVVYSFRLISRTVGESSRNRRQERSVARVLNCTPTLCGAAAQDRKMSIWYSGCPIVFALLVNRGLGSVVVKWLKPNSTFSSLRQQNALLQIFPIRGFVLSKTTRRSNRSLPFSEPPSTPSYLALRSTKPATTPAQSFCSWCRTLPLRRWSGGSSPLRPSLCSGSSRCGHRLWMSSCYCTQKVKLFNLSLRASDPLHRVPGLSGQIFRPKRIFALFDQDSCRIFF